MAVAINFTKRFLTKIKDNIEKTKIIMPETLKKGIFILKNLKYLNKIIK
jgi:hypothetical protein